MAPLDELTAREREVLGLLLKGASNREIARTLVISGATVENHLHHIYKKLGVSTRTQAAIVVLRMGMSEKDSRNPSRQSRKELL